MPQPGDIVEIKDKDRIVSGVALSSSGKQIHVLNPEGREFKTSPEKIFFANSGLDVTRGKDFLASHLRDIDTKRESIKNEIQLPLLWEMVHEEDAVKTPKDLAQIYFGHQCGDHETAAMIRALYADFGYFRPRGSGFFPMDEKTVRAMEVGRRQQEAHKAWEQGFAEWLHKGEQLPPPKGSEKALQALKEYLIFGDQPSAPQGVKEFLRKAKISDFDRIFRILKNAGLVEEDENLLLRKYHVPREFPPGLNEAALAIVKSLPAGIPRLDLTGLRTFSIDDATTTDIDDALSVEVTPEGWRVGIHIADAAEFVPKDSPIDKEAHTRSTSIYLPDEKINMLPEPIVEAASLTKGETRPALSILTHFYSNGRMTSWELKETFIKVNERLSYDEADERIESEPNLAKLYEMASRLQEDRIKSGAVIVQFPRIEVAVDKNTKKIEITHAKPRTKSQILVSEWMIIANHLVANYCSQEKIPTIYRTQDLPAKILPFSPGDWVTLFKQRRYLRRGEASVEPSPHHALGLQVYLQMTSPLRRYSDLVVHRQLKAKLRNEPLPYTLEELEAIIAYSERWVEISDIVEREWKRYWLLKYLEPKVGSRFEAIVLETNPSDYLLFIPELSLEVNSPKTTMPVAEGDPVDVILELVKPRLGVLKVIPDIK